MVVTAHFIDYDWQLQKRILSFSQIVDHKGDLKIDLKKAAAHEKIGTKELVVLDVPTRWNSTYLMLESAVKLRKAFEQRRIGPPNFDDWDNAKFRFDSIYGVVESKSMISKLKGVLSDLYEWYDRFYSSSGRGAKETDDVFSFGVGSGPSDDLEFSRLMATDKEDSLWGMKQQEEDINKGKSEMDLYLLKRAEKLNERFDVLAWWKNCLELIGS
ncbi:hypothetical protein EZV62_018983 [Acer yangbiense]|uniref:hAT-like transposase RNase-H fold domain-containing protein n=1 Tax=Acer yangbiense TaxID=1000413 RepID=A0A5C7HA00_9ROSI|nr:hypothetical protein EZV62_018983 [Acer yangbiense]